MKARLERELLQKEKQGSSGAANLADEELLVKYALRLLILRFSRDF
ncbi:hypothetical protein OROMI_019534 [Orobanche minor]